jgi:hypothetical protein
MRASAALVLILCGCAGEPPGQWDAARRVMCRGPVCYRLGPLGPDWRLAHVERSAVGFYNERLGAVVSGDATCRDDGDTAPLAALTRQLLIGYTDRQEVSQERLLVDGREALHTVTRARLDGVPVVLDLIVLKRNGCIFDLAYVSPPETWRDGEPDFGRFVAGFVDERRM